MNDVWPREEGDYMEIGSTHWVPQGDGYVNSITKEYMDSAGNLFNEAGELIKEADEEEG